MKKSKKPLIGYTCRDEMIDVLQWLIALSIRLAGGTPVRLHPKSPKYNTQIDGLVIGGGTDLYPPLYKLDPKPDYEYDLERDALEIEWLQRAERKNLPVLGICRGAQLINVRRGGSLHMDVAKAYENAEYPSNLFARIFFRKSMNVMDSSTLSKIFKSKRVSVNSMHKQAIDKVGKGLVTCAKEDNGVVQAIEDPDKEFFIGVQFHPEAMTYKKRFRNLFENLVRSAKS